MSLNQLPITVGASDTNGMLAQDLGQQYVVRSGTSTTSVGLVANKLYRLVYNNSGGTLAAGAALIEQRTDGCRNGKVTTTTQVNNPYFAGTVPAEFGSNTVAAASYFLMQIGGNGKAQFANTEATLVAPTTATNTQVWILGTATTAGYMQMLTGTATGTAAAVLADIGFYLGGAGALTTQTVAVTAAGQLGTVNLFPARL